MNERKPHGTDPGSNTQLLSWRRNQAKKRLPGSSAHAGWNGSLKRNPPHPHPADPPPPPTHTHTHMYWETYTTHTTQSNPQQPSTHRSQDGSHLQKIKDTVFCLSLCELARVFMITVVSVSVCKCVFARQCQTRRPSARVPCLQKYNTVSLNLPNNSSVYERYENLVFFSLKCFLVSFYRRSEDSKDVWEQWERTWRRSTTSTRLEHSKNWFGHLGGGGRIVWVWSSDAVPMSCIVTLGQGVRCLL